MRQKDTWTNHFCYKWKSIYEVVLIAIYSVYSINQTKIQTEHCSICFCCFMFFLFLFKDVDKSITQFHWNIPQICLRQKFITMKVPFMVSVLYDYLHVIGAMFVLHVVRRRIIYIYICPDTLLSAIRCAALYK